MKHKSNIDLTGGISVGKSVTNTEVVLDGNTKDVNWDWSQGCSFHLKLRRSLTLHAPTNVPSGEAIDVNLVVEQDSAGFYNITWSDHFKWASGTQPTPTQSAGSIDVFSFHVSPTIGNNRILGASVQNLFYNV